MITTLRVNVAMMKLVGIWLVLAAIWSGNAMAETTAPGSAEAVRQSVAKNVAELIADFNREKHVYQTNPQDFYKKMDASLTRIVDFRRIAARVMGKYSKQASTEQKDRFVEVFKKSLYETYTKTLIESGAFEIRVTKATINDRSDDRASVDLEVVSDNGQIYPVVYSMYRRDDQTWLLENVIVFGVNIGLAFRDRFEDKYREHRGQIDSVINAWSADIDIKRPETAGNAPAKG